MVFRFNLRFFETITPSICTARPPRRSNFPIFHLCHVLRKREGYLPFQGSKGSKQLVTKTMLKWKFHKIVLVTNFHLFGRNYFQTPEQGHCYLNGAAENSLLQ